MRAGSERMTPTATRSTGEAVWSEEFFQAPDGTKLFQTQLVPPNARAAVLVIHGYADHAGRYRRLMEDLAKAGYAAFAMDYRGHGRAGGRRCWVDRFDDYLGDLRTFHDRVRAKVGSLPLFIVAHSHGALVSATWLTAPGAPTIDGLALSSPYFQLAIEPSRFQLFQAKVMGRLIPTLSIKSPLTVEALSSDVEWQKSTEADPLYERIVCARWFHASNEAQAALWDRLPGLKLPTLVLQGGADSIASPKGAERYVERVGSSDKRLIKYEGFRHEVFNEVDRARPVGDLITWLDAHTAR